MTDQIYVEESGLRFGPYAADECFKIEELVSFDGVKRVEFVLIQSSGALISLVEARSSIPKERDKFYLEILFKFRDSLDILLAEKLGRQSKISAVLPEKFKSLEWDQLIIDMILVIPRLPNEQLPPITDQLKKILKPIRNIFHNHQGTVIVLNEEKAEKYRLIISDQHSSS